ncbi:unnamed protein product [Sphagnum jensenii]|uniref:Uncharacterized protein n=1 Tax=Sphagnum jensenii TaxID=128206 RepID=A0ABP0VCP7_9BRYO
MQTTYSPLVATYLEELRRVPEIDLPAAVAAFVPGKNTNDVVLTLAALFVRNEYLIYPVLDALRSVPDVRQDDGKVRKNPFPMKSWFHAMWCEVEQKMVSLLSQEYDTDHVSKRWNMFRGEAHYILNAPVVV